MMYLLSQMFKKFEIKLLFDSLTKWEKFLVHYHLHSKKQINIFLTFLGME
jgi:hypothetical protein